MESTFWILLPCLVAAGSALLGSILMRARMGTELAHERDTEAVVQAAEEEGRRKALQELTHIGARPPAQPSASP